MDTALFRLHGAPDDARLQIDLDALSPGDSQPVRRAATGWAGLTAREQEVARRVAEGHTSRQVARLLQVSERTVHAHLAAVLAALGVRSRAALPQVIPAAATTIHGAPAPLTVRQADVAALVAQGWSNRAVAERLGVTTKTVEKHLADVFQRWAVSSRTAVAARWWQAHPEPVAPPAGLALRGDQLASLGHGERAVR